MKKKTQYPIYFTQSIYFYFCILNEKEAMSIMLYDHTTLIQHEGGLNYYSTWIHTIWKDKLGSKLITKSTFNAAYKKARKILQEKLKT